MIGGRGDSGVSPDATVPVTCGKHSAYGEAIMMNIQLIPVLAANSGNSASVPAKKPRKLSEVLNEAVVVIFFSLGPALGATIFLMWFGGIVWGLLSSFLR